MKSNRPTILLVHNFYREPGGEDWHVTQLVNLLKKKGHEVATYFRASTDINKFSKFQALRFPFELLHSWKTERELDQLIRSFKPDLVHIHNIFPLVSASVYRVCKKYRIPIMQSVHNYRLMCLNGLFMLDSGEVCERCAGGNFLHGVIRKCYQKSFLKSLGMAVALKRQRMNGWLWKQADIFICPTGFVKSKLEEAGCPSQKIFEVPYFVPEDLNVSSASVQNAKFALYLGRLSSEKGIQTLLNAFEKMPDIPLVIAGGGPLAEMVKSRIQSGSFTHIQYLGYVKEEEKQKLLKNATCLIFPSECYETTGITMLESFQVGTPVIASRFGRREFFVKDGENGWLFEVGNPKSLEDAVRQLFKAPHEGLGLRQNAHKTFRENFSEVVVYERLMNCYQSAGISLGNK